MPLEVLLFLLFYTPCVATLGAVYSETKSWKFTLFVVIEGLLVAMVSSATFYLIGTMLGVGG